MLEKDRSIVEEFKQRIPRELLAHIRKLIVFGSRARNEASEDSDLDLLALVDKRRPEMENRLEDAAYKVMWDHDFKPIISLKIFDESSYFTALKKGFSFYKHIEKDGISV